MTPAGKFPIRPTPTRRARPRGIRAFPARTRRVPAVSDRVAHARAGAKAPLACPPLSYGGKRNRAGLPLFSPPLRRGADRPSVVAARGGWDRRLQGEVP